MSISNLERQTVIDVAADGYGVIRPKDLPAVLIPFAIDNEVVDIHITHRKRQVWYGEIKNLHLPSPHRVTPQCTHFGLCGGCRWQMMDYQYQLHHKRRFVEQALHHIGKLEVPVPPVIPSPQVWRYRNKAEYAFGYNDANEVVLGFHPRGAFDQVLGIEQCWLMPAIFEEIRLTVLEQVKLLGLTPYNPRTHKGLLRSLLIRGTEERCIALLSIAENRPEIVETVFAPLRHKLQGYGYFHNPKRNDSLSDLTPHPLHGDLTLEYQVKERCYRLGPKDFFQVNLSQAANLVEWIRQRMDQKVPALYDLYGGVGLFAVGLADKADTVFLVEKLPEAVQNAQSNLQANQSHFPQTTWRAVSGSVETTLSETVRIAEGAVAIVDPPREGLHPKLRRFLARGAFDKIVYVSCHPATQARDIAELHQFYQVTEVQPFDLFPHTTGIENVVIMKRR
ncbi:MAG: 23S rRNA (uracil(1939)-C(5))-methyltransferase RlmD [Bacteroidia bacterium]|nr:23S rRNA (uracil(1939)-C(5))-methyltransferase RlmD [Bacteroidia bacterium]MCX7651968.1 23S rRNA (uracil(1939)-C(5))-methyltransferase RlmD [Bacteroidia bacterium]MDW8416119.1 23S rRNA (uracil(1939)-C(5))-methyltransferase RlmD [Bacteroidia bacterium]